MSAAEVDAEYPCDRLAAPDDRLLTRGIDIDAPAAVVFRWLCQIRVAPYSYDWVDNLGRRSPRTPTPGADDLAVGQRFAVIRITAVERDRHITGRATAAAKRLFDLVAMTYAVSPRSASSSRLVARLVVHRPTRWWQRLRYAFLAWGDLVMMRKQLLTLKTLAEGGA